MWKRRDGKRIWLELSRCTLSWDDYAGQQKGSEEARESAGSVEGRGLGGHEDEGGFDWAEDVERTLWKDREGLEDRGKRSSDSDRGGI